MTKRINLDWKIGRLCYPHRSLSDVKIAGSLINQGFPFSVLAKCLQFFEKKCEENFEKVIRLDNWFPNRTWHQE